MIDSQRMFPQFSPELADLHDSGPGRLPHIQFTSPHRWMCDRCGELHTGQCPTQCACCGSDSAHLIAQVEMRWELTGR